MHPILPALQPHAPSQLQAHIRSEVFRVAARRPNGYQGVYVCDLCAGWVAGRGVQGCVCMLRLPVCLQQCHMSRDVLLEGERGRGRGRGGLLLHLPPHRPETRGHLGRTTCHSGQLTFAIAIAAIMEGVQVGRGRRGATGGRIGALPPPQAYPFPPPPLTKQVYMNRFIMHNEREGRGAGGAGGTEVGTGVGAHNSVTDYLGRGIFCLTYYSMQVGYGPPCRPPARMTCTITNHCE